ncbi:MAG: nucleoside kinase [Oscillospiraceae bacterium]|jgi:uridine kinase|nr:nucleoside kinase [Oscillospiraceae bacterium]
MTTDQLGALLRADPAAVLENDRLHYHAQVSRVAQIIAHAAHKRPIVLLAGPSGSGKTTTALLIERELDRLCLPTHTLSMDDYFVPLSLEQQELVRRNQMDLETPLRVDIPFFQQQMGQLLAGEEVLLPRYNFHTSSREFDGRTLRRKEGEFVIMEGIHALNPMVTAYDENTTRVYVSVRTRMTAHDGTVLHPSKIRLLRRLLRDRVFRGRSLAETAAMRGKVDRGEQRYILPFKERAHCSIDSFYSTELSVYRPLILQELCDMLPQYPDFADIVQVMRELPDLADCLVPPDSLLREFIGGGKLC